MKYVNLSHIKLQHIEFFLTIAETLNITQAAGIHNVSQPLLSQYLTALEDTIGLKLFDRNGRRIALTSAGVYLKKEWSELMNQFENTLDSAHEHYSQPTPRLLRIGLGHANRNTNLGFEILRLFEEISFPRKPSVRFEPWSQLFLKTKEKKLDLAILAYFETINLYPELCFHKVYFQPNYITMARDHPLAGSVLPSLDVFKDCIFYKSFHTTDSLFFSHMYVFTKKIGSSIHFEEVGTDSTLKFYLEAGMGVSIELCHNPFPESDRLITIELAPEMGKPYGILYRKDASESVKEAIAILEKALWIANPDRKPMSTEGMVLSTEGASGRDVENGRNRRRQN
jgi:DNA-binding transcriptional LysR family regulator